jgi:endoglucanase
MKQTVVGELLAFLSGLSCLAALGACHEGEGPKTAGTGSSTVSSAVTSALGTSAPDRKCPAEFTLDDAEDDNNQILSQNGRGGYWYTYADKAGTQVSPVAGAKFTMASGGAGGSAHAARLSGNVSSAGEVTFAGMGFSFTDPKRAYDASAFTGVSFWARAEGESATAVRLKVPDASTDPAGGACTACFNDFGADLTLTRTWTRYTVPFAAMKQLDGWGSPHPSAIDAKKLYGLQWQVVTPGAHVDLWIDDIQFTGCP